MKKSTTSFNDSTQYEKSKHKRIKGDKKRDLIFRTLFLNEKLRSVCHELDINLSTGKNIIQRYKKTGHYIFKSDSFFHSNTILDGVKKKGSKCTLGILVTGDENMKLVSSRNYQRKDESELLCLHAHFLSNQIV